MTPQGRLFGSLTPYEPGRMERATNFLGGLLGDNRRSHRMARKVKSLLDWVPVAGDTQAAVEALDAYDKEEYIKSGLLSGAAVLGIMPVVGDIPANMLRQAAKAVPSTKSILRKMQKAELTEKENELLALANQTNPEFKEVAKHMLPGELSVILNRTDGVEQTSRLLDVLPTSANFAATAKLGTPKKGWYEASTKALVDVFGPQDARRFATLLAATSPQNSVEMNLLNTLNIWKNWTAAGRPTDPKAIKKVMGASVTGSKGEDSVLDAWVNNSVRALGAKDPSKVVLSGPKVDSFYRNLVGDVMRVTNDAHVSNFAGIDQGLLRQSPTAIQLDKGNPGYTPAYAAISALTRLGAQKVGMNPAEGQETIWSVVKPLVEIASANRVTPREALQRGMLTPELIRGTPDFSTLLKEGGNKKILQDAGYGEQINAMVPHQWPTSTPSLSAAEQREVENTAGRLGDLVSLRNREARSKILPVGKVPDRAFVSQTAEGVPGVGTGHLPSLPTASQTSKANVTARTRAAFNDLQGRDIINNSLGLKTVKTRPTQGAYRAGPDSPIEFNPGYAAPVEVPLTKGGKIPKRDERRIAAAAVTRAALTGQHAVPYSGMVPDKKGVDLLVPRDKKLAQPDVENYVGKYGLEDAAIVDYGQGAGLLNWTGKPYTRESAEDIGGLLGGSATPESARNVANPDMRYIDLQREWDRGYYRTGSGSGKVTRRMMAELDKLGAGDFNRLSNDIKMPAADLYKLYAAQAKKGEPVRQDLMNLLKIVADKGLVGLKKAVGAKAFLPSLAAIGLAPSVYRKSQQEH